MEVCGSDSAADDLGSFRVLLQGVKINLLTQDPNYPYVLKERPVGC